MNEEAAVQAEIERRRRKREAALKRGIGAATPTIQALQASERPASTPGSPGSGTPRSSENPWIPALERFLTNRNPFSWPIVTSSFSGENARCHVSCRLQLC